MALSGVSRDRAALITYAHTQTQSSRFVVSAWFWIRSGSGGSGYLQVVLEHELVSGQEVLFGEQLHVLTDVLNKLDGIRLNRTNTQTTVTL